MAERLTTQQLAEKLQRAEEEALLADRKFRRFLFRLFRDCSIYYPTYQRGDPHGTSYWEGRRASGLEVLHRLQGLEPGLMGLIEQEGNLLAERLTPQQSPDDIEDAS